MVILAVWTCFFGKGAGGRFGVFKRVAAQFETNACLHSTEAVMLRSESCAMLFPHRLMVPVVMPPKPYSNW